MAQSEPTPLAPPAHWRRWHSQCAVCRGWGRGRICDDCTLRFGASVERCQRCAVRLEAPTDLCGQCVRSPPPFERALAAVDYAHPWDRLIGGFKFNGALDLTDSLARLLVTAHQRRAELVPDLMLPVPLSPRRLRERGYNQSWELTRRCARLLGCPTEAALLLRVKDTPHQMSLPRQQRIANVRGAFAVEPTQRAALRGQRVTLVDDVMTTQATASELTRVLLDAGALSVQVWVVARTPHPDR